MTSKTKRLINKLYDNARTEYALKQEAIETIDELDLREIALRLDDPDLIQDKKLAVSIARMLLSITLEGEVMVNGSFAYKLALGLINYLGRGCKTAR